ncbi:MAG: tRNA lysidine(34) synthetase TilS [Ruminococcaceae bacterium]|nr:tRNA lysidine(34) synthetase TilS [Oscillospiraceae bacterium]
MTTEEKVLGTISQFNMIKSGDRVLAAVSGGADSVCMLHILSRLKQAIGFEVFCAHLNHGLRGEAADNDEKFVAELCKQLGIKVFTRKTDVAGLAKAEKLTVEEAGRKARYDFFAELSQKHKLTKIATAHNQNDNAETVLMRIIRGTGIDGLSGIPHTREDVVIRPVLDISRREIEEYCKKNNLEFCTDATNADNDYTRNKIRNRLIPYLEQEFNPEVCDALSRLAETATEDADFLNGYAKRLYARLASPMPSQKPNALHIDSLKLLEKSVAVRIVRLAAAEAMKDIKLSKTHIEDIFKLLDNETGSSIDLPQGLNANISYGWLAFTAPSFVAIDDENEFFAEVTVDEGVFVESIAKEISFAEVDAKGYKCAINETMADLDKIGAQPLFLRSRRDGDRIVWFPDGRTKKIKSVFIDEKIPKNDRNKIPLLCTGDEVVAIVGSRVSEKYKVTKDTERALVIKYGTVEEK